MAVRRFVLYASDLVAAEASAGDAQLAQARLQLLAQTQLLQTDQATRNTAQKLVAASAIPPNSYDDALHVAVCAVNGLQYLLTWNCRHIANPATQAKIDSVLIHDCGLQPAMLVTPETFLQMQADPDSA